MQNQITIHLNNVSPDYTQVFTGFEKKMKKMKK